MHIITARRRSRLPSDATISKPSPTLIRHTTMCYKREANMTSHCNTIRNFSPSATVLYCSGLWLSNNSPTTSAASKMQSDSRLRRFPKPKSQTSPSVNFNCYPTPKNAKTTSFPETSQSRTWKRPGSNSNSPSNANSRTQSSAKKRLPICRHSGNSTKHF